MYAYVITIQWQNSSGTTINRTQNGTYVPRNATTTRNDVFEEIYDNVRQGTGCPSPSVVFYSLEKNALD